MRKLGIDVSKHQGIIDWKEVKKAGIKFAIIRAGFGRTDVDPQFHANVQGCIANNIPFGVYWFIYGINESEAIQNAELCAKTIASYKDNVALGVWCDFEYDTDKNAVKRGVFFDRNVRTKMVIAFCERMKSYGYNVGNYANPDYIIGKFNNLSQYPLWLAWYHASEESAKKYNPIMWQYSSEGSVPGIIGRVDMNYYYGELEEKKTEENPVVVADNNKIVVHCYSKAKEGSVRLSENFKVKEFACKDGSDVVFVAPALVEILQKIRNHFGKAVNINSGYRTPTYNQNVGGATYSQHLYGTAADIRINGVDPKYIAAYAETLLPNSGGIGVYKNFVHVDVRKDKSLWNG